MFIFLLPLLISLVSASLRIPIVNETVHATLRMNVNGLSVSHPMNMKLSPGRLSSLALSPPEDPEYGPIHFDLTTSNSTDESIISERVVLFSPQDETQTSYLAIGSASSAVGVRGSVFVIHETNSTTSLVLADSSSMEEFFDHCLSNPAVHIPSRYGALGSLQIDSYIWEDKMFFVNYVVGDGVLSVPREIADQLSSIFFEDQCTQESLGELPEIVFRLGAGMLIIKPSDYTRFSQGICEFLITVSDDDEEISFNPLLLPITNVRFTREGADICDSALTD